MEYLKPEEIWEYLMSSFDEGDNLGATVVAESEDGETIVFAEYDPSAQSVFFDVEMDDDYIYSDEAATSEECESIAKTLYRWYIMPTEENEAIREFKEEIEDDGRQIIHDWEEEIQLREEDLRFTVEDFLADILGGCLVDGDKDEVIEDCKEHFLLYLYKKHGLSPYRPMIIIDEGTNEESFVEYPYPVLYK